jgi:hypothetical protein
MSRLREVEIVDSVDSSRKAVVNVNGELEVSANSTIPLKTIIYDTSGNDIKSVENALNVHVRDLHYNLMNKHIRRDSGTSEVLTVPASIGDTQITVANGATFSIGDRIVLSEGTTEESDILKITAISTHLLSLDKPIENAYTTAATAEITEINLKAAAGSLASPVIYSIAPQAGVVWHITRLLIVMSDQTAMDDSRFGGITGLTNGVVIRESKTQKMNLTVWRNNGDFAEDAYDVFYADKAPAGYFGIRIRWSFTAAGAVLRLDGNSGDSIEAYVQDDLTGLDEFEIKVQGHIEE